MSDTSSGDFPDLSFTFSAEDLTRIDASIEAAFQHDQRKGDASFPAEIDAINAASVPAAEELTELVPLSSQTNTIPLDNLAETTFDTSFSSDAFELNIGRLSAEELELIDASTSASHQSAADSPSIQIELEDAISVSSGSDSDSPPNKSPLKQFRSYMPLSVTDLCAPSWCEVQYDYGLRGMRSRPLAKRPKSFVSSSGKTISPAVPVAQENDVTTKQGQKIHKELEREIKFEELQVDITTHETRWALRLVNMIACLRGIMGGFTREMPVFGILHDEVVVGIMDEVVKGEIPVHPDQSPDSKHSKRPLDPLHSVTQTKRAKKDHTIQTLDRFFTSPTKAKISISEDPASISEPRIGYALYIKDSKTRRREFLPSDADTYSGRIQLMIYRRLLSELVSRTPPYNFRRLWDKLGLDSAEVFPTRFLVQARLIEGNDGFKTACLDDLVDSWHKLVKELNIMGVDPHLELIYRLQPPPPDRRGKDKATEDQQTDEPSVGDEDMAKAIAASLQDMAAREQVPTAGPSSLSEPISVTTQKVGENQEDMTTSKSSSDELFISEDVQLQWALQQSILPRENSPDTPNLPGISCTDSFASAGKGKSKASKKKEQDDMGIRRFKIIGTKTFLHDDRELDDYLTQVLKWWRGERRPEGVSLEHSYRCRTCEYAEDCEWRAEKALEHSSSRRKT